VKPTRADIQALCAVPQPPEIAQIGPPRTAAALAGLLSRRWFQCSVKPGSVSGLDAHEGLEFTADGNWYFLRASNGGFERDPSPDATGTYLISNTDLAPAGTGLVGPTDTTFGLHLLIEWFNGGRLELGTNFFYPSPLRFKTLNGIVMWFVALDVDGTSFVGGEGMACETGGAVCGHGTVCVSENNSAVCSAPAAVGRGEGCDHKGTRTCTPPLVCLETRQCGDGP
jgi:hypothetical protein